MTSTLLFDPKYISSAVKGQLKPGFIVRPLDSSDYNKGTYASYTQTQRSAHFASIFIRQLLIHYLLSHLNCPLSLASCSSVGANNLRILGMLGNVDFCGENA